MPASQDDTRGPMPPMPDASSVRPTSRRGSNPILSLFASPGRQR
jgi:hypothetical protein